MTYHIPVLAAETVKWLNLQAGGTYVDATFGGGGHSRLILADLGDKGHLYVFDQDEDARANVPDDDRLTFIASNFRLLQQYLRLHGVTQVDGILADLGVSSHQFDTGERGFSYRFDAPLDMRMEQQGPQTAADLLHNLSASELQELFSAYGEVRNARTIAEAIVSAREQRPFIRIGDLLTTLEPHVRGQRARYLAQVFQALRIAVNDEMGALKDLLEQATQLLRPGGRLVVLSYHSLEDRLVKNYLKSGNAQGTQEKDFYGHIERPYQLLTKKPLLPTAKEITDNPRARSAKLRVGEKR